MYYNLRNKSLYNKFSSYLSNYRNIIIICYKLECYKLNDSRAVSGEENRVSRKSGYVIYTSNIRAT